MRSRLGLGVVLALVVCVGTRCGALEAAGAAEGLVPPPAISVPYGGRVVTDINLSDKDLLGVIKQVIPALGEVIGSILPMAAGAAKGPVDEKALALLKGIDFKGLAEAISGITNVRLLVVRYPGPIRTTDLTAHLDSGVAKLGKFSRVLNDISRAPGVLALYAQADGGGYVGYAFDPGARSLYAFRIIGTADLERLTKWVMNAARLAVGAAGSTPVPSPEPGTASEGVTPAPAPEPAAGPQD